ERGTDALALVATRHGERDLRARAPAPVADELRDARGQRIPVDVGDERLVSRVDSRERRELAVRQLRLRPVEAASAGLGAGPLEQRRDRHRIAVLQRPDDEQTELLRA